MLGAHPATGEGDIGPVIAHSSASVEMRTRPRPPGAPSTVPEHPYVARYPL